MAYDTVLVPDLVLKTSCDLLDAESKVPLIVRPKSPRPMILSIADLLRVVASIKF